MSTSASHSPIRLLLADDHTLVRRGIAALLQQAGPRFEVVIEASDGEEALSLIDSGIEVDVAILDLAMPRLNGIETARRLARSKHDLKTVILSMYADAEFVHQALEAGAGGYVLKESLEDELFAALTTVMAGDQFVSPAIKLDMKREPPSLTSREREIIQLIGEGYNTSEIAEMLSISPHTASRHRANLMAKLNTHTQAGLVKAAIEKRLIIIDDRPG